LPLTHGNAAPPPAQPPPWESAVLIPRLRLPRLHLSSRRARTFIAIAVSAVVVATVSSVAAANKSVSVLPVADSWVNSVSATTNYGMSSFLRIDGSPVWKTYLRFDLSGVPGTISRVELELYPITSGKAGLSVHGVVDTTWGEKTIDAANAPAMSVAALPSGAIVAGKSLSVDVTSLVHGHGLVSLALTDNSTTAVTLGSRHSTTPPQLVVTEAVPAPSPTAAKTAAPSGTITPTAAPSASPSATPAPGSGVIPPSTPTSATPVRAAFYYPWFSEAWNQSGMNPFTHYHPSAGFYNGASQAVVANQIAAMQYGKIGLGIASWWGQGTGTDAKIPTLLSAAAGTGFKWAFYYELEGTNDPSVSQIQSDLTYINSHYGSNPSTYRIGGRPVIFVYAQPADGCGMVTRWAQANASGADYVVLKVFPGYAACSGQPNGWHQYSPAVAEDHQAGYSFSISPGFWLATGSVRLARDTMRWQQEVRDMVASREPWQLITTFNEWGEGTAVESATEWASATGYGAYLDILHNN
jgi:hypothetical protein